MLLTFSLLGTKSGPFYAPPVYHWKILTAADICTNDVINLFTYLQHVVKYNEFKKWLFGWVRHLLPRYRSKSGSIFSLCEHIGKINLHPVSLPGSDARGEKLHQNYLWYVKWREIIQWTCWGHHTKSLCSSKVNFKTGLLEVERDRSLSALWLATPMSTWICCWFYPDCS